MLVVVGLLLRFKLERWLLGAVLVIFTVASLFTGDWSDPGSGVDSDPLKVSRWFLIIGGLCLLIGWSITAATR
ncbi:hypothetical protein EJV47_25905 [Hymenobacter gummosus]|uniref:Uncharacterized protein n=1 Tax=Hymenobacter gummosus TaxID=1776032 RepID=A0A431TVC3_9BACT|nr:hypothetical protein [Hymenobacter gummosus]RTQ45312.1 hypothetical protein EJV47_25905 [Hymenobacter gummosus]